MNDPFIESRSVPDLTLQQVVDRGLTPRTLAYWVDSGFLHPVTHGRGNPRHWPPRELEVADLMRRLVDAGLTAGVAALTARAAIEERPLIKLAPGIVLAIDTDLLKESPPDTATTPQKSSDQPADNTGHIDAKCSGDCDGCMFCNGGLWACTVCGGLEGGMPSTCPGESMTAEQSDAVYAGDLDFRDGKWVEGVASRFCPKGIFGEAQK